MRAPVISRVVHWSAWVRVFLFPCPACVCARVWSDNYVVLDHVDQWTTSGAGAAPWSAEAIIEAARRATT